MNYELAAVKELEKKDYNNFVAAQESGSFLQSWEWGEWQTALGRQVFRYKILDDSGFQIGSIQLIKMLLPFGKHYFYCPYGPVVNFKFQISNFKSIFNEIISKFSSCIFIRIEPKLPLPTSHYPLVTKSANIQPGKTLVIDLSKSEEQLLAEMHPKTRYNIRLAQKYGVEIKDEFEISIGHGLFAKEAVALVVQTGKRQGYKSYGIDYYQKMINFLAMETRGDLSLHIYKAIYNNQLLVSAVMIDFGKTRTFLFGGSSDDNKNVMAPYLMHFKAMLDAKTVGMLQYDFWGVETSSGEVPGFVRFKLGFGGQVVEYLGAYDLVVDSFGYSLYKIFRKIKRIF